MAIKNLNELFLHELKDVYDAEQQLVETLPKMAENATDPELAEAFREHLAETEGHVTRLEQVFAAMGEEPEAETCEGMKGLLEEGNDLLSEDAEPTVKDAALIGAAQRIEHYEIAAYGTLRVWAATMGMDEVIQLLEETLEEEKAADQKLTTIAEGSVNIEAETEESELGSEEEGEGEETARRRPTRAPSKRRTSSRSGNRSRSSKPARSSRRRTRAR
jgi:ferritin-like metal-binding protein YciE